MSRLHKRNAFLQPNFNDSKYPINSVKVTLYRGDKKRDMVLTAKNPEVLLNVLNSAGASQGGNVNEIYITDVDGSVNNIAKALLILKTKKMISPELLNQIYDGFPDYNNLIEPDNRIRASVENGEVANIRKAARILAQGQGCGESPVSLLPDELCTKIAALYDDRGLLDAASARGIAYKFFKRPEKKDNSRAVAKPRISPDLFFPTRPQLFELLPQEEATLRQARHKDHINYGAGK